MLADELPGTVFLKYEGVASAQSGARVAWLAILVATFCAFLQQKCLSPFLHDEWLRTAIAGVISRL